MEAEVCALQVRLAHFVYLYMYMLYLDLWNVLYEIDILLEP